MVLGIHIDDVPAWLQGEVTIALTTRGPAREAPEGSRVLATLDGRPFCWLEGVDARPTYAWPLDELIEARLSERWLDGLERPLFARLPSWYQVVPGPVRQFIHSVLTRKSSPPPQGNGLDWPWPVDPTVEGLRWLGRAASLRAGETIRTRPFWPGGKTHAVCLSHDVDTRAGMDTVPSIVALEEARELRSAWYVVGEWAREALLQLEDLAGRGHEIGMHGPTHDGRLPYLPAAACYESIRACVELFEEFRLDGFRAPALLTSPALDEAVGRFFAYDSSRPDTDIRCLRAPAEGSGTVFPYRKPSGLLVLPITLPLDDKLLLLGYRGGELLELWKKKIAWLRQTGGLVMVATHAERHLGGAPEMLDLYEKLLEELAGDGDAWYCSPAEAARWWTAREQGKDTVPPPPPRSRT